MPNENYAIVLDYLPEGRVDRSIPGYRREKRIAQVIGEDFYTLLEVVIRPEKTVKPGERIYIGKGLRDKTHHIVRRIHYKDLTSTAKSELAYVLENLVKKQETKFIHFFNECGPLTTRLHRLELLPGIGKKHMWDITKAREVKKFESYNDLVTRVRLLPDPVKLIVKRILWELIGTDERGNPIKYKIFVDVPLKVPEKNEETTNNKYIERV